MKKKALTFAVLLAVLGLWWLRDPRSEVERLLDEGKVASLGTLGGSNPEFSFKSLGTLKTVSPKTADPRIRKLAEGLKSGPKGLVAATPIPAAKPRKESLIPRQPLLTPQQQKELNQILNGPYKDVTYLGNSENGTVRALAAPDLVVLAPGEVLGAEQKSQRFFAENKALLRLNEPGKELALSKSEVMNDGTKVLRFQQTYGGLEVWPAQLLTNVAADGRLTVMTGAYVPTPEGLDMQASLAAADAVRIAWGHVGLPLPDAPTAATLKIYSENGEAKELAFEVMVEGGMRDSQVFVSAKNGAILASISRICTGVAVSGSGVGLTSTTPLPLNLWQEGSLFYAIDTTKPMYNAASGRGLIVVYNMNNQPSLAAAFVANSTSRYSFSDPETASALYNLGKTYDFFKNQLGRDSYDNTGSNLYGIVRYVEALGVPYPNAHWDQTRHMMMFGTADRYAGALDVIGHEVTHGVVQFSADLVYKNAPGALNESFSDIFGEGAEWAEQAFTSDWKMGTAMSSIMRDMKDPGSIVIASGRRYPACMSDYISPDDPFLRNFAGQDAGGVHINSSIPNHAFYLLTEDLPGGGIGRSKAHQIFYRTLTTKLTKNSDFLALRAGAVLSAQELYGVGSNEVVKVKAAFDAVEIYEPQVAVSSATEAYTPVDGVDSFLYLYPSGSYYYLARRELAIDGAAANWVSTYAASASTRPSVTGDGAMVAFVASDYRCAIASTSSTQGSQQTITGSTGTFNSMALSPAGDKFACILRNASTGIPESKLYTYNLETSVAEEILLYVPNIDGTSTTSFTAVDEIDFSPDGTLVCFDGFSRATLADGTVLSGWSIYILNLRTKSIYALLRPPAGWSISRPSFSRTGTCRIVFEARNGGFRYVLAWDLASNAIGEVRKYTDTGIGAYPRFFAADNYIAYTAAYYNGSSYSPILAYMKLAADHVSPDPNVGPTMYQYDGRNGLSYRRGTFNGPPLVTVAALDTSVKGGSTGKFRVSRISGDQAIRVPVSFKPIGTARPGADYARIDTVAVLPAGVNYVDINVSSLVPAGGATKALTLSIDPQYHYSTPENPTTATMSLTAATPTYAEWAAGLGVTTKSADDDGDGYSNLLEYALGMSPTSGGDVKLSSGVADVSGQKFLQLSVNRTLVRPGIIWSLERSADMVNWSSATSAVITDTASQLVLRDTLPLTGAEKRFIRLRATEQ